MSDQAFNDWYDRYVGEAIDKYAGLDTTNPKGIAQDAWQAAIEADRQRWGISNECEPVGYIMPTALKQLKAGGHAVVGGVSQGFDVPIYTAPQPAEPVKVPSEDDIEKLANQCGFHRVPGVQEFARAVLAQYGQPVEPEGWQLVPKEPTKEMLAATSWPNCAGTDYRHMLAAAPKFGEEE